MPASRHVRVGQLVHDDERRLPREDAVEVHLLERLAAVLAADARDGLEAVDQRLRLLSTMRLDDADDDLDPLAPRLARGLEHGVRLADAGRSADEDLEPASL